MSRGRDDDVKTLGIDWGIGDSVTRKVWARSLMKEAQDR